MVALVLASGPLQRAEAAAGEPPVRAERAGQRGVDDAEEGIERRAVSISCLLSDELMRWVSVLP